MVSQAGMIRWPVDGHYSSGGLRSAVVTDQQTEETNQHRRKPASTGDGSTLGAGQPNATAIAAGLSFLMSQRHDLGWRCSSNQTEVRTTAYVLARLGDLPNWYLGPFRPQIEHSLNWLVESQQSEGGWGLFPDSPAEAASTAWAVAALRLHGRSVPDAALAFLRQCQQKDGSFVPDPEGPDPKSRSKWDRAEITSAACLALQEASPASTGFLTLQLREQPVSRHIPAAGLLICSTILDWDPGTAPSALMNEVCRFIHECSTENTLEQGLLLRCSLQLRLQRTWSLAMAVRNRQSQDGSWPGRSAFQPQPSSVQQIPVLYGNVVLSTANTLSAMAMGELQPGLYFGSDLPFRRLAEF